jgi:hypothetical protein
MIKLNRMRWAGHVARMGERRGSYKILMEKPEGKRPLRRPRRGFYIYIYIYSRKGCRAWTFVVCLNTGQVAG